MENIRRTSDLVKHILETTPDTRDNDQLLYYMVCYELNMQVLGRPFGYVLLNLKDFKIPPFESVRRTLQKVQASYPELMGKAKTVKERRKKEKAYREYARGNA